MYGTHVRAKLAVFGALTALGLIILQGVSAAHHPEISAQATCIPINTARITLDVVAWDDSSPERRTHNDVVVTLTAPSYSQTFRGAFSPSNNFSFTITVDVPADGTTYTAVASTDQYWGPNRDIVVPVGPQSRSTTVMAPMPCPIATTTVTTTTVPATTSTPNTTVPTTSMSTTAPSTTVGVSVQGVVETAPTTVGTAPQGAVETAPTTTINTAVRGAVLARTGTNTMPFVVGGTILLLIGTAIELDCRRRRSA